MRQLSLYRAPPGSRVCDSCGASNALDAIRCGACDDEIIPLSREQRRSRRRRVIRATTMSMSKLTKSELECGRALYPPGDEQRPKTRADCIDGARPCPFVGCRHNLYLDVGETSGSLKLNFPDIEPEEMPPGSSCVLDLVEDERAWTLENVAERMNLTRERIRQIENVATEKLRAEVQKRRLPLLEYADHVPFDARRFASSELDE